MIKTLSNHKYGGFSMNVWPTDRGVQANVSVKKESGWSTHTSRSMMDAIDTALKAKMASLRIGG